MLFVSYMRRSAKILILNKKRDHRKKNSMSVAPMSRQTKRAYLRLCPEKRRKKEFMHLRVKVIFSYALQKKLKF